MNINLAFKYILVTACVVVILFGVKTAFNAAIEDTMNQMDSMSNTTP